MVTTCIVKMYNLNRYATVYGKIKAARVEELQVETEGSPCVVQGPKKRRLRVVLTYAEASVGRLAAVQSVAAASVGRQVAAQPGAEASVARQVADQPGAAAERTLVVRNEAAERSTLAAHNTYTHHQSCPNTGH